MDQVEFEALRKELHHTLYEAGQCLHYWRCYNDPKTVDRNLKAMESFSWFFQIARLAFLTTAVVDVCKLYEEGDDSLSLPTFRKRAAAESLADPGRLLAADKVLSAAEPIYKRVKVLRNKVFAHRNIQRERAEWFEEAAVTPDDLFELRKLGTIAFNHISGAYDKSHDVFNLDGPADFERLLAAIGPPDHAA